MSLTQGPNRTSASCSTALARATSRVISPPLANRSGPDLIARRPSEAACEFATALKRATSARKSHALFAPEPDGPDACRITVESVYPDHNERQTYRLERSGASWLVTALETVRSRIPRMKYGSPAGFVAPEGVPVSVVGESSAADD